MPGRASPGVKSPGMAAKIGLPFGMAARDRRQR